MIISPGASLSCVVGGMLNERVYGCPYVLRVCKSCPECSVHTLYLGKKVWKKACVKWPARKPDVHKTQGCMATPTRKCKYEEVRWSLSHSSLAVCRAGVSAFHFPIVSILCLVAIMTTHCTVHMSVAWRHCMVWQRGHVQYISITWMGQTQSVTRSVNACGPRENTCVGLAHARLNKHYSKSM